jgi:UDP-N-acetylmuramoylalanine--D-glutamate ligase
VVLIGRDAPAIAAALPEDVVTVMASSFERAVSDAREIAREGDRVLLSPACASFDMFRDYNDRGDQFRTLVEAL